VRKSNRFPKIFKSDIAKNSDTIAEKNPLTLGTVIADPIVNSRSNEGGMERACPDELFRMACQHHE
jgi:hypothetical protein